MFEKFKFMANSDSWQQNQTLLKLSKKKNQIPTPNCSEYAPKQTTKIINTSCTKTDVGKEKLVFELAFRQRTQLKFDKIFF